jgi:hypothetical protein
MRRESIPVSCSGVHFCSSPENGAYVFSCICVSYIYICINMYIHTYICIYICIQYIVYAHMFQMCHC